MMCRRCFTQCRAPAILGQALGGSWFKLGAGAARGLGRVLGRRGPQKKQKPSDSGLPPGKREQRTEAARRRRRKPRGTGAFSQSRPQRIVGVVKTNKKTDMAKRKADEESDDEDLTAGLRVQPVRGNVLVELLVQKARAEGASTT